MVEPTYTVNNDAMLVYFLSAMEVRANGSREAGVRCANALMRATRYF